MEVTAAIPYRLKVRLGPHEFEAEGPEASVKEQFATFVTIANTTPVPKNGSSNLQRGSNGSGDPEVEPGAGSWDRAYKRKGDQISLHVLPETKTQNADAIILILYGHQMLLEQESVTSLVLMEAAKQSGLRIDRIDRNLPASHKQYVISGGTGKGTRYSLNNRGAAYAQEMLDKMFD
jgi:hypothetical protein